MQKTFTTELTETTEKKIKKTITSLFKAHAAKHEKNVIKPAIK